MGCALVVPFPFNLRGMILAHGSSQLSLSKNVGVF
jgi:hypothetical protein